MFVMLLLAAIIIVGIYRLLSPVASAEELISIPPAVADDTTAAPATPQLVDGDPQPTSLTHLRRDNAYLTWTPTGVGQDQDTYDVRVATVNGTDASTGELTQKQWFADGLTWPSFTMTSQSSGTYFWQVRSCEDIQKCGNWSAVWSMTLDDIPPIEPTATITSGSYDRNLSLSGYGERGTTIVITVNGVTIETVVTDEDTWSATYGQPFEYGDYEAQVTNVDVAGNRSPTLTTPFSINELFVATQIEVKELPVALEIVPVDESHENLVFKQPVTNDASTISETSMQADPTQATAGARISTEGGIVQSSQSGWRVLGLPWFLWAGLGGMLSASWFVSSGRLSRSFSV